MLIETISVLSHMNLVSSSRKKCYEFWINHYSIKYESGVLLIKVLQIYFLSPKLSFPCKKKMSKKKHLHWDTEMMGQKVQLEVDRLHRAAACVEGRVLPACCCPSKWAYFLSVGLLVLSGYEECCLVFEMNKFCPGYIFKHCGKSVTVK